MINSDVRIPKTSRPKGHKLPKICIESSGLTKIQSQFFVCTEPTNPKICLKGVGREFWEYLKKQVDKLKLDQLQDSSPNWIELAKTKWLRVCFRVSSRLTYLEAL